MSFEAVHRWDAIIYPDSKEAAVERLLLNQTLLRKENVIR